jgi:hypothetical protein
MGRKRTRKVVLKLTKQQISIVSDDKLMNLIPKMPKGYVGKNTGTGEYTISTPDGEDIVLTQSRDKKKWSYEPSNTITNKIKCLMDNNNI